MNVRRFSFAIPVILSDFNQNPSAWVLNKAFTIHHQRQAFLAVAGNK